MFRCVGLQTHHLNDRMTSAASSAAAPTGDDITSLYFQCLGSSSTALRLSAGTSSQSIVVYTEALWPSGGSACWDAGVKDVGGTSWRDDEFHTSLKQML